MFGFIIGIICLIFPVEAHDQKTSLSEVYGIIADESNEAQYLKNNIQINLLEKEYLVVSLEDRPLLLKEIALSQTGISPKTLSTYHILAPTKLYTIIKKDTYMEIKLIDVETGLILKNDSFQFNVSEITTWINVNLIKNDSIKDQHSISAPDKNTLLLKNFYFNGYVTFQYTRHIELISPEIGVELLSKKDFNEIFLRKVSPKNKNIADKFLHLYATDNDQSNMLNSIFVLSTQQNPVHILIRPKMVCFAAFKKLFYCTERVFRNL